MANIALLFTLIFTPKFFKGKIEDCTLHNIVLYFMVGELLTTYASFVRGSWSFHIQGVGKAFIRLGWY